MTRAVAALVVFISACNYVPSAPEQHTLDAGSSSRAKEEAARAGAVGLVRDAGEPTPVNSPEL